MKTIRLKGCNLSFIVRPFVDFAKSNDNYGQIIGGSENAPEIDTQYEMWRTEEINVREGTKIFVKNWGLANNALTLLSSSGTWVRRKTSLDFNSDGGYFTIPSGYTKASLTYSSGGSYTIVGDLSEQAAYKVVY